MEMELDLFQNGIDVGDDYPFDGLGGSRLAEAQPAAADTIPAAPAAPAEDPANTADVDMASTEVIEEDGDETVFRLPP